MRRLVIVVVFLGFAVSSFAEKVFDCGVYLRLRQEYLMNALNFDDDTPDDNYFRIKAGVWGRWNFSENVNLYVKLMSEPKIALDTDGVLIVQHRDTWDEEIYVDNLYLDVKNLFGMPVDLRLGRQDFLMTHGEGFVIMDGTPYDGSRSFYFNAARATVKFNKKNSLDIIYVNDPPKDEYLPVINPQDRQIVRSDEEAFIFYGKFKPSDKFSLEPYYIYKFEDATTARGGLTINTVGNRAVLDFAPWRLRGELAYQFGDYKDGSDREAWGGYTYLTRFFKEAKLSPSFEVGYAYLSGDDPATADDEGWNPVFSKWPWISELYVFGSAIERGEPGYWSNIQVYRAKLDMNLTEKTGLSLAYNYLRANENSVGPFFGTGDQRGHLAHIILTHKFTKNIDGHLHFEYFKPEDYYAVGNRDDAIFLRWQLQMQF